MDKFLAQLSSYNILNNLYEKGENHVPFMGVAVSPLL